MIIAPSLLNSKLYEFEKNQEIFQKNGITELHIDVMDGNFVPDQANGPKLIRDIRPLSNLYFDIHLMISSPERKIENYLDTGADGITFHIEATSDSMYIVNTLKNANIDASVAVNPGTSLNAIEELLPKINRVLIMTANPGRSEEQFHLECLEKIKKLNRIRKDKGYKFVIQSDGKVDNKVITSLKESGCDHIVSGGYIFNHKSPGRQIQNLIKELDK
ncbi:MULTISPECIES: ribulose-phosphate 3-epimerase [Aerococcus]|uniref:Ribulose-phosphate 3-epimerase n=3 Tax=Aerococcus TaxID=1375 RepID=A0A1E9PKK8_9LACT|nr:MULTISPECIES: ribulose-phosphate 3-epimerase [Aerococcus]KAA9289824.1 ribulose-phosphate 3-epimerase [Aerococcus mictus]MBU5611262.1 ribulose-phosphate 3-epimerase [Aerococcus urinae]MCY3031497.1 ribulose-phosphate 3-epimerase [Aerococcus sp. Group 1]MCY3039800.1 ribulose-phosphate 3-epimerase [Aerococcus sp. Group 2]MCY3041608.1 ribulose-phosphate 3-epimerase [Aerococcus sp. Group 2]